MTRSDLIQQIISKKSFLCVGLDSDLKKIPKFLLDFEDPIFEFNKRIINSTKDYCIAYKPNIAFYECLGTSGWESLEKTLNYIPKDIFTIADAKRGDIGNTSHMYAKTFFEYLNFDAVTVTPYMGGDSISPFLDYEGKWVILLGLTSNKGADDFQLLNTPDGQKLFQKVIEKAKEWGSSEKLMFVAGATNGALLSDVRAIAEDYFLLVPGIGTQGGNLDEVVKYAGLKDDIGLLVNSSRGIIYAANNEGFEVSVSRAAKTIADTMSQYSF